MNISRVINIITVILVIFFMCSCSSARKTDSSDLSVSYEKKIIDTKSTVGEELLERLDTESFDVSVTCLGLEDNVLKTSDVQYDGDEKDNFIITSYILSNEIKIYNKNVYTIIDSDTYTSQTTVTYSVQSYDEFKASMNSVYAYPTAYLWFDDKNKCSVILTFGETVIWD